MLGLLFSCIFPIGLVIAYYDGYTTDMLMNFDWLFTHDMIYVVLTTQIVVVLIMLMGLKDYLVVKQ
jgi:hypothetical protein